MNFAEIVENVEIKSSLFSSLREKCGLNHIQYYSPYFRSITKNINDNSILKTKYNISNINTNIKYFNEETDIKKTINKLIQINHFDEINNIYELSVNLNNNTETTSDIICKVSPIINPVILFNDDVNPSDLQDIYETNKIPEVISSEINAENNFAYVESFILYNLSNLTNNNLTPMFPNYYGSINGIAKHYYFNITEYLDDIYGTNRFDKVKNLFKILYFTEDDEYNNSDLESINFNNSVRETPINSDSSLSDIEEINNLEEKNNSENFFNMIEGKLNNNQITKIKNAIPMDDLFNDLEFVQSNSSEEDNNPIDLFPELDLNNIPEEDSFSPNNKNMFICLQNYPVNYCFMEKCSYTLESYLEDEMYHLKNEEWYAIFFQLAYGLAVANKLFNFVHSDLHECNVMFTETEEEFIYYTINDKIYRIPTYGKIVKIIDFARSALKFGNKWILSNHYNENKEAYGIYDIPDENGQYTDEDDIKPNPSFDLVRFFTTISQYVEDNNEDVYNFIYKWSYDDDKERNMIDEENEFELYVDIAHNCHNTEPIEFLKDKEFTRFIFTDDLNKIKSNMKFNFADCDNLVS
jgi:hypothetical protein